MAEIILHANIRKETGRTTAKAIRNEGRVPGIFYLRNEKNIPIVVNALDMRPLVYTSDTHLVDLRLDDGTSEKCVIREIQFDPITDKIVHFDLIGLVMSEQMEFEVPIVLEGSSVGVREGGGMLSHLLHKVQVRCLPGQLPDHIAIDISEMRIGDVITVRDIVVKDLEILADAELPVVTIAHHRGAGETVPVADKVAETDEPQVIGKGKTAKEGE